MNKQIHSPHQNWQTVLTFYCIWESQFLQPFGKLWKTQTSQYKKGAPAKKIYSRFEFLVYFVTLFHPQTATILRRLQTDI